MSARVAKLEALLARVQERANEPRPTVDMSSAHVEGEESAPAETPPTDELEPTSAESDMVEIDEIDEVQEIEDVELDEPGTPESGPIRSATPSIDDAMDDAAHQPPLTPPPESGEEIASPQIPRDDGPTMEQLGETIALEEGNRQEFELDEPSLSEPPPPSGQAYVPASVPPSQEQLTVPENAQEELDRVRLGDSTPLEARVSSRPVLSTNVVDLVSSARKFTPQSFLELLDASLELK